MRSFEFKHTFTVEQQEALWQYFIDHSKIQKNAYYGIMFYVKDRDDFFERVFARFSGDFKRYDKLEKAEKMATINYHVMTQISRKNSDISQRIDKSGTLVEKLLLWLHRKTRQQLFGAIHSRAVVRKPTYDKMNSNRSKI